MTIAKPKHIQARELLLEHLNIHPGRVASDLDPAEVGIVGGPSHISAGTSYHLGKDDLKLALHPYSVYESPRDRNGLNHYASAMDIGQFSIKVKDRTYDLRHFSAWVVLKCKNNAPQTQDIREVICTLDGKTVRRWDRLRKRTSGDESHLWHTHISEFRDANGSRMVQLIQLYLEEIGLIQVDLTAENLKAIGKAPWDADVITNPPWRGDAATNKTVRAAWALYSIWELTAAIAKKVDIDDEEIRRIGEAVSAEFDENVLAERVLAGFGQKNMTDVSTALRAVLTAEQRRELSQLLGGE